MEIYGRIRPPVHRARLRPLRAKQWNGRPDPGPGKGARAGGGAETRRDPRGPSLVLQPRLCPPSQRSRPRGVRALALRPRSSRRAGTLPGWAGRTSARRPIVAEPVAEKGWRARMSPAQPLRVFAVPGPGAPWLPDLGPGNRLLEAPDPARAARAASRGRLPREAGTARGPGSPPGKAVWGDGWRWLRCPRLRKVARFLWGKGKGRMHPRGQQHRGSRKRRVLPEEGSAGRGAGRGEPGSKRACSLV